MKVTVAINTNCQMNTNSLPGVQAAPWRPEFTETQDFNRLLLLANNVQG